MTDLGSPLSRRAFVGLAALAATARPVVAAPVVAAPAPSPRGATPSPRQIAWHRRERYAFIHFAMNTFTGKEWGYGDEASARFAPTAFDPDQIVAAVRAGGLNGLILTAKHHDGFCLWPTTLTDHCIRNSPYRAGQGDIVGELAAACARAQMPFGLYLSPWDRNRADYGQPSYVEYYHAQLTELCTRYGPLFELWFDGANGGDGWYGGANERRTIDPALYYDWPGVVAIVRRHQPGACTFGPFDTDIRWVGNEDGRAGDPCWPTLADRNPREADLNHGVRGGALWWPAESDVSIRPGWFQHADEDAEVKSPARLWEIYNQTAGRGANLILNVPPDRRGRVADPDVAALKAFGDGLKASFADDQAKGSRIVASAERGVDYRAANVIDGRQDSYWSTPDLVHTPTLTLDLPSGRSFDLIRVREHLPLGCRVTRFAVDVSEGSDRWRCIADHEAIGPRRIVRLAEPLSPRRVRLRIVEAQACPAIAEFALFRSVAPAAVPTFSATPRPILDRSGWRVVAASEAGAEALLDGDAASAWTSPAPASVTFDMGGARRLAGFVLTPAPRGVTEADPPARYVFEASDDGREWRRIDDGEFSNIANARALQRMRFAQTLTTRYIRLGLPASATGDSRIAVAEFAAIVPEE